MIRHIVMWKLKDPADAPRFKALLDSCAASCPACIEFEVGIRATALEANVDVVLVSLFSDARALDAYQNHPHHKAVSAAARPLRETAHVLDYDRLTGHS